jgi:hypothetical protein
VQFYKKLNRILHAGERLKLSRERLGEDSFKVSSNWIEAIISHCA